MLLGIFTTLGCRLTIGYFLKPACVFLWIDFASDDHNKKNTFINIHIFIYSYSIEVITERIFHNGAERGPFAVLKTVSFPVHHIP